MRAPSQPPPNTELRRVRCFLFVALAIAVGAALIMPFLLRQIVQDSGLACATPSILMIAVPLFLAWVLYLVFDIKHRPRTASIPARG